MHPVGMLGERLREARRRAGLTQTELAVALGDRYNAPMVSMVERNQRGLLLDGATAAARELHVSLDYLIGLTDDPRPVDQIVKTPTIHAPARMGTPRVSQTAAPQATAEDKVLPFERPGIGHVPFVQNAGLAAGAGGDADDERVLGNLAFRTSWLKRHGLSPEHCRVIEVVGNSMEPTLQHRAIVLVDFLRNVRRHGKIFAVRYADGPVVKRLRHDKDGWWLDSDNVMYPSMPWLRDAEVLGQVMWTGRTL